MGPKDYRAIGSILHAALEQYDAKTVWSVTTELAQLFANDNPRFDLERFLNFVSTGRDRRRTHG